MEVLTKAGNNSVDASCSMLRHHWVSTPAR